MAIFTGAEIKLLSDKWRETVLRAVLTVCLAALGIVGVLKFAEIEMLLGTAGLLILINHKPLGLDMDGLKRLVESMRPKK